MLLEEFNESFEFLVPLLQFDFAIVFENYGSFEMCFLTQCCSMRTVSLALGLWTIWWAFLFEDMGSRKVERDFCSVSTKHALWPRAVRLDSLRRPVTRSLPRVWLL